LIKDDFPTPDCERRSKKVRRSEIQFIRGKDSNLPDPHIGYGSCGTGLRRKPWFRRLSSHRSTDFRMSSTVESVCMTVKMNVRETVS
jgi:hypothetical protein